MHHIYSLFQILSTPWLQSFWHCCHSLLKLFSSASVKLLALFFFFLFGRSSISLPFLQHFLPLYISIIGNLTRHFYLSTLNLSTLMLSFPDIQLYIFNYYRNFPLTHWQSKRNRISQTIYNLQKSYNCHPDNSFRASSVWLWDTSLEITVPSFLSSWSSLDLPLCMASWTPTSCILPLCLPTTAVVYTYIPFPLNQAPGILSPSILLCEASYSVTDMLLPKMGL